MYETCVVFPSSGLHGTMYDGCRGQHGCIVVGVECYKQFYLTKYRLPRLIRSRWRKGLSLLAR